MKLVYYFLLGSIPLTILSAWQDQQDNVDVAESAEPVQRDFISPKSIKTEQSEPKMIDSGNQSTTNLFTLSKLK